MSENLLSTHSITNSIEKQQQEKDKQLPNSQLKYREILCPKTGKALNSAECSHCSHVEEFTRAHPLGLTLSTLVCLWEPVQE